MLLAIEAEHARYLKHASPEKQREFVEAAKRSWVGLDALYSNQLTALCRPEELLRLVDYAGRPNRRWGLTIDSAMITDVPGYTWGLVPVLSLGGVKYLSAGPNSRHRVGSARLAWDNRPFYWISPCRRGSRVGDRHAASRTARVKALSAGRPGTGRPGRLKTITFFSRPRIQQLRLAIQVAE